MTQAYKARVGQTVASLLLAGVVAAFSFSLVKIGIGETAGALVLVVVAGMGVIIGVRHRARARGGVARALAGWEDRAAAVFVGAWMLTVTFNGIQVVSGVSLGDAPLLAAAALAAVAAIRGLRPRLPPLPHWIYGATYLLVVSGIAGPLFDQGDVAQNLAPLFRFAVTLLGVPAVLAYVAWSSERRRLFAYLWLVSVAINCAVAISDRFGTDIGATLTGFNYAYSGREAGLTEHPTHLGLVCAMALPTALALGLDRRSRFAARIACLTLVILIGWTIVLTGSRSALLAAPVAALVVAIFVEHTRAALAIVLAAAAGLAVTAALVSPTTLSSLSPLSSRTAAGLAGSDTGHLADVLTAQTLFFHSPLVGTGFSSARSAQDIYLQLLEAGGIVALLAFAVFIIGVFRAGAAVIRQAVGDDQERVLAGALMAGTGAWLVEGLFQPPIYDRYLYVPAGLITAMALSRTALRGGESPARPGGRSQPPQEPR